MLIGTQITDGFNWNQAKLNAVGTQITDGFNWNQAKLNALDTKLTDEFKGLNSALTKRI